MAASRIVVEDYAGIALVTFTDSSILDTAAIDQIGKDLYQLVDFQNKRHVVLDFSNVKFLASHALGMLLTLHKKAQAIKGSVALAGLRGDLLRVFSLTGLDRTFKFYPSDSEALRAFNVHV